MTKYLKTYNPVDATVFIHSEVLAPGDMFTDSSGTWWYALTGSVGYVNPLGIRSGMVNNPIVPLPDTAVTAVAISKAEFYDDGF